MNPILIAATVAAGLLAAAAPAQAHKPRASVSVQLVAPVAGATVYYGSPYYRWHRPYGHPHARPWYGSPWHGPSVFYAPPPLIYAPPTVIAVPVQPPVYIERDAPALAQPAPSAQAQPAPTAYWYYCASAGGYYPYVAECPGGWQPVPAQPAR
jgi:hypothetical protein